jgi:hypothetical protein
MKMFLPGVVLGVSLMGSVAEAAVVRFEADGFDNQGNTVQSVEWKMPLSRFNPSLGNLISAELSIFGGSYSAVYGLGTVDGNTEVTTAFTFVSVDILGYGTYSSDTYTTTCTAPLGGVCYADAMASAAGFFRFFVHPDDLQLFAGVGTVDVTVSYLGLQSSVEVDVEYTYAPPTNPDPVAPVPLPATGGLLLAAAGGLALMRRRKAA